MVNSREKGKRGERLAAEYLRTLGFTAHRTQQYSGVGAGDVDAKELPNVHIEVKFGYDPQSFHIGTARWLKACEQAMADAKGKAWCVLWRPKLGKNWLLTYLCGDPQLVSTTVGEDDVHAALLWLEFSAAASERRGARDG